MGVCINYSIGIETQHVKKTLDRTQKIAEGIKKEAPKLGISVEIRRTSDTALFIDIGDCETLSLCFDTYENYVKEAAGGWQYETAVLSGKFPHDILNTADSEHLKRWPGQRLMWTAGFTKTQFAKSVVEHKWVADLVRSVAMYAPHVSVNDEGDYYHTGILEDAASAIGENGALINAVGAMLSGTMPGTDIVKGGETVIKPRKKSDK